MKKAIYTVITILAVALSFTSCKKEWHCTCSFNNKVMFTKDLMNEVKSKAQTACSQYDSTVTGEVWSCTIY
ncbi:MAG: hypothetical protein ACHQD8_03725 [Chitinophagales bacterium]